MAVVIAIALVLLLVLGLLWMFQDRLVYFPYGPAAGRASDALPGARDLTLRTDDGLALGAWFVPATSPDRGMAVLVAHGNGGNRAGRAPLAAALSRAGFSVLMFDYRGYGGNPGWPREEGLARDARAAYHALRAQPGVRPDRILYFGESLGAAVVAGLAVEQPPAALLLRSPFVDLPTIGQERYPFLPVRLLLRERYPVAAQVARLRLPITVVYGTADTVVPPEHSRRVAAAAPRWAQVVTVPGADHNDPVFLDGPPLIDAVIALAIRADTS